MAFNPDVYIELGVEGGGTLTGVTGRNMMRDISAIVSSIEDQVTTRLEFGASDESLNRLITQIESAFSNADLIIDTSRIEAQLREATNNINNQIRSAANNASSLPQSQSGQTSSQDEIRQIERTSRAVSDLTDEEQALYNTQKNRLNLLKEIDRLNRQANLSDSDKDARRRLGGQLGAITKRFKGSEEYSARYAGVRPGAESTALTRQIVLEEAQHLFESHNLIDDLQEMRSDFSVASEQVAQDISDGAQEISDAIELQGNEVEEATDEVVRQIDEGTEAIIEAYQDRQAAIDEINRQTQEALNNDAYRLLNTQDTLDDAGNIAQRTVNLYNNQTGQNVSRRYTIGENDDGGIDLNLISTESNRQVQNYLTGIETKLESIRHKRDQIVSSTNMGSLTGTSGKHNLVDDLDAAINSARELESAIRAAVEAGDFSNFSDPDFLDGRYSYITDATTATRAMNAAMEDVQFAMKGFNSELNKAEKQSHNLVPTFSKVENISENLRNNTLKYNTDSSKYQEVLNDLNNINALRDDIERYGSTWSANAKSATSYAVAMRMLSEAVERLEYNLKELDTNPVNLNVDYIRTQLQDFVRNRETFMKSSIAQNIDADLYNNADLSRISAQIDIIKNDTKDLGLGFYSMGKDARSAYAVVLGNMNQIIDANTRLSAANQKIIVEERQKNNVLTQTGKAYSEALRYYREHEAGIKKNIDLNRRWQNLLKQIHNGSFGNDLNGMRASLSELQVETKDAGAETTTLHAKLKKLFHDHFGSVAATTIIGAIGDVLRNAYTRVLDIDKAMTELRKVTDLTEESYRKFGDTAAAVAREVGGTIADTINATADFARLGFSLGEATELAKAAMVYKNVGDGIEDISQASESIISTIKGFGLEASDAMAIIDKFNEVGNNYAIDSVGIGEALKRSAAALSAANNTLDESIALATAANNVIQDPDVVGTALKTMSMFLRAAKTEAEEAGIETEGMANSVSELREEMKQLTGIDIMIDDATFKSTYQILQDISRVWDKLTDVDQANISEMLVGKRQANIFFSLVENFEEAENVLKTSLDAAGSAAKENEKFLASIEGRIQSLLVAFEELSSGILDSELIKGTIGAITTIVEGLNAINELGGNATIPVIAITGALTKLFSSAGGFGFETIIDDNITYLTLFGEKISVIGDKTERANAQIRKANIGGAFKDWGKSFFFGIKSSKDVDKEVDALWEYCGALHAAAEAGDDLQIFERDNLFSESSTKKIKDADIATKMYAQSLRGVAADSAKLKTGFYEFENGIRKTTQQASVGMSVLKKFGGTLANIGISLAIDLAITAIIALVQWLVTAEERAEEARQALVQAAKESSEQLAKVSEELDTIRQRISDINSGKLTITDDKELEKLQAQEAALEAQYAWLLKIDEFNNQQVYAATNEKIFKKKTIDETIVLKEPNGLATDEAFGEYDSFERASMYINSIEWYQAEMDKLLEGGLRSNEAEEYAKWSTNLDHAQKYLGEITQELKGYIDEGSVRYSDDPNSPYAKIISLLEETTSKGSFETSNNTTYGGDATAALVEFLKTNDNAARIKGIDPTGWVAGTAEYNAPATGLDPTTGQTDNLVKLYSEKTIDALLESFLQANPVSELSGAEFKEWQKKFKEYVYANTDGIVQYYISHDIVDPGLTKRTEGVKQLLSPEAQIELLEKDVADLNLILSKAIKDGDTQQIKEYSEKVAKTKSEIENLKKEMVNEAVDLSEDLAKADSDYTSQLTTHIENLSTKQDELQTAYDKIIKNGSLDLDSDEAKELLKLYPELIKYSDEYTNTLNVPADVLQGYFNDAKNTAIDTINSGKKEIEDAISNLETYGDVEGNAEHKEAHEALLEQKQLLEAQEVYIRSWSLATGDIEEFTSAMEKSADLTDKFNTLSEANKALGNLNLNSSQWLSDWDETLSSMKEAYPDNVELEQAIRNYKDNATEENARAVVEIYNDLYQKDIDNYNAWLDAKAGENTWDNFISENTTFVEDFKRLYGIDLLNYASYQEAKAKLAYDWATAEAGGYESIPTADREILKKRFDKEGLEGLLDEVFSNYNSPYSPNVPPGEDDDWFSNQKEKYEKDLQAEEERYNRGIISYEEYLKQRKNLLNLYFPAGQSQEGDEFREEQIKDIDWDNLYLSRMSEWDKQNDYDSNNLQQVIARVEEQRRLAEEMFGKTSSEYYSPTLFAQYITEAAESEKEALTELLNRGVIEYDEFFRRLTEIREQYTDADGKYIIPISFVTEGVDPEKQINDFLSKWDEDNGYSEDSQDVDLRRRRAAQWREQIENSDYNNESSALYNPEKVEEMLKEVENYEDNTESMALEQTRNAIQKLRDERERMWNEEQEALDKINEKEQRRLDIVKARIDLENAKKNRNQLVFANGSYYYDYDQEALRNAEEKFSDAVKADEDANREEAKEADLKVYDTIIDALDELGDDSVSAIDAKTLSDALSDYKDDGKISDDNLAEMQKILGEDSELLKEMKDGTLSMDADQIREIVRGMVTSDISQSVVSTEEQEKINQAVSEVANNIYDNSITIGNIVNNVTMPEGTTQQQVQTLIDGFASELIDHLHSLSTKIN